MWSLGLWCSIIFCSVIFYASFVVSRQKVASEDKTEAMMRLSSHNGIVTIDNTNFKSLVKTIKKPYRVILMLTVSHPKRKCVHCGETFEEFALAASSWRFSNDFEATLFFASVDFDYNGMEVFQSLQINSAPVVLMFEAGSSKKELMSFEKFGFSAEGFAKFIEKTANIKITIKKPVNYVIVLVAIVAILVMAILVYKKILSFSSVQNFPWGFAVLFFIVLMTSGHMWNHIRGAQFMQYRDKEMVFIETWGEGQFVVESYIIMFLNLAIGFGLILLSEASGKGFPRTKKRVIAVGGILLVAFFFYLLMKVFKKKYEGYPYSFFFL